MPHSQIEFLLFYYLLFYCAFTLDQGRPLAFLPLQRPKQPPNQTLPNLPSKGIDGGVDHFFNFGFLLAAPGCGGPGGLGLGFGGLGGGFFPVGLGFGFGLLLLGPGFGFGFFLFRLGFGGLGLLGLGAFLGGPGGEVFVGGLPVQGLAVLSFQGAGVDELLAGGVVHGAHEALGRQDRAPLHHAGDALVVQDGDQGLADAQLAQDLLGIQVGVGAEGLGGGLEGLLVLGGVGPQGVLDLVAQLAQDVVGNVGGGLGDEVDAHPLGADQAHHLFDLLEQGLGGVVEEQVGLIEEEDHLGLVQIPGFGEVFVEFGKHPQHEGGVEHGLEVERHAVQDVDDAPAVGVGAHPVRNIEHGLAEEHIAALGFQGQQGALDGSQALGGDVAVVGAEIRPVIPHVLDHGPQVLEVQQEQALVVGDFEDHGHDAGLGGV